MKQSTTHRLRGTLVAVAAGALVTVACAHTAAAPTPTASVSRAPGASESRPQLTASPRHGEWVTVRTPEGDSLRAWIVYPERSTKAPVVVVIHEIFGLSTWIRAVTDQLAADGYIAIAPDLLTGKGTLEGDTLTRDVAVAAIRTLKSDDVQRELTATARYAMSLPAAQQRYAIVGFCWGGTTSFEHAVRSPTDLAAAVVYYGTSPDSAALARVRVPVLGLYGGNDARVDATIAPADSVMRKLGKSYEHHVYPGAGHGFLRAQDDSANAAAARQAWPLTLAFLRSHLGT